jgi:hypothetical protein
VEQKSNTSRVDVLLFCILGMKRKRGERFISQAYIRAASFNET